MTSGHGNEAIPAIPPFINATRGMEHLYPVYPQGTNTCVDWGVHTRRYKVGPMKLPFLNFELVPNVLERLASGYIGIIS
jgi:hypothetical protein